MVEQWCNNGAIMVGRASVRWAHPCVRLVPNHHWKRHGDGGWQDRDAAAGWPRHVEHARLQRFVAAHQHLLRDKPTRGRPSCPHPGPFPFTRAVYGVYGVCGVWCVVYCGLCAACIALCGTCCATCSRVFGYSKLCGNVYTMNARHGMRDTVCAYPLHRLVHTAHHLPQDGFKLILGNGGGGAGEWSPQQFPNASYPSQEPAHAKQSYTLLSTPPGQCHMQPQTCYPGNDFKTQNSTGPDDCCTLCAALKNCAGFTFRQNGPGHPNCFLKHTLAAADKSDCTSGYTNGHSPRSVMRTRCQPHRNTQRETETHTQRERRPMF